MADEPELRGTLARVLRVGGLGAAALLLAGTVTSSRALLWSGLWLTTATPAARVAAAGWSWWRAGERRYAAVCAAVLALLAGAVVLGVVHR